MTLLDLLYAGEFDPCRSYWDDEISHCGDEPIVVIDPVNCLVVAIILRSGQPKPMPKVESQSWRTKLVYWLAIAATGMLLTEPG